MVSRRRRRKGGLGLYAQKTLKCPRTVHGARRMLFAPQDAVGAARRREALITDLRTTDLQRVRQRTETFPRHWGRLPK